MTLFQREKRTANLSTLEQILASERFGLATPSGVPVDDEQAMRLSSVWACWDLISELVSTLPVEEYRQTADGRLVSIGRSALTDDPGGDGYGFEMWARQVMVSWLSRGNVYGWVEQIGDDGWPKQIASLHPDEIQPRREQVGGPVEWYRGKKRVERWPLGPLWHVPAYVVPGSPVGVSPIRYAAETIGQGLAARRFGAQFFRDGGIPAAVFESEHQIDQATAEAIKARLIASTNGNREPIVLGAGGKLRTIQVAPNESQFLETTKATVADVARYYRIPPEMIGGDSGNSMTYANVETRSLALLTYTLNGWMVRLERALSRMRPGRRIVKFNPDALVRVDLMTRYKAHDLAIRDGWKSRNDIRRVEDEAPIPGGDEYLWPPFATALPTDEGAAGDGPPQPA